MKRKILVCLVVLNLVILLATNQTSFAAISSCTTSVTPNSMTKSATDSFYFTVHNASSAEVTWIKITRPSAHFDLNNATVNGWNASTTTSEVILTGGTLDPSGSVNVTISATSGVSEVSGENWTVEASDDSGGSSPTACTGGLEAEIAGEPSDNDAPTISSVTISDITDTKVKITWNTDEASDSEIYYSIDNSFELYANDTTMNTSHSITLTGLTANTTYNFRINSTDEAGNTGQSSDSTFSTAAVGATSQTITVTVTTTKTITPAPTPTPIPDKTPPTIIIDTDLSKPFTKPPLIKGKARDVKGVVSVDYSLDGGKNWTLVDSIVRVSSQVAFDFTPPPLDDDNYAIKIRAKDTSGNTGISQEYTMVIDRLPPLVGAGIISLGPQILSSTDGVVYGLEGLDQKITLSAVGGPTSIVIYTGTNSFSLMKNKDNGLWSGILNLSIPGSYFMEARSIDGASNKTIRKLNPIHILPNGIVKNGETPVKDAMINVYYKDYATRQFVLWDGKAYGQQNPQKTDKNGKYKLYLPPGTYFLEIKASGYKVLRTNIVTIANNFPINSDFQLTKSKFLQLGHFRIPLPDFTESTAVISLVVPNVSDEKKSDIDLIGNSLPTVDLKEDLKTISTGTFTGKLTIVTFLNSWDPQAYAQINILNDLVTENVANVISIFPQESASKITIFKKRGGYRFPMLADKDGQLIEPLSIHSLPMSLFLDRKGVVRKVSYGVMTKEEMLNNLIN